MESTSASGRRPVNAARLTTEQVAQYLGVKPATVYAYASRGLLTSQRSEGRTSTFDPAEVERLVTRARGSRGARAEAPVVASALTFIDGERHWYRGRDALRLAADGCTLEEVAGWLWESDLAPAAPWTCPEAMSAAGLAAQRALPASALPLDRLRVATTAAGVTDSLRYDTSPAAVVAAARHLVVCLVESLPLVIDPPPTAVAASSAGVGPGAGLAERLWPRLTGLEPTAERLRLLQVALVVMADHELPVSTLATRLAASTGAHIYAVVSAGLGAIDGPLHGAASLAAEALVAEIAGGKDAARAVGERLRRGERIPGFGQPLYPDGDPRARLLLEMLRPVAGERAMRPVDDLVAVMAERGLPAANVDLAIAAVAHQMQMIGGAAEAVFTIARVVGWVAHAREEYASPTHYRPRAVYVGPPPDQP